MAGTPETYQDAHEWADIDATTMSAHHTLGPGAVQAAPGNHDHDGKYATVTHNHEPAEPIEHEHPLYLPIIDDTPPTINPDGMPLKVGQLWFDSDFTPSTPQLMIYNWDGQGTVTSVHPTMAAISGWAKAIWTAPGPGIVTMTLNGRLDSTSSGVANDWLQASIGYNKNTGGMVDINGDDPGYGGQAYIGVAGRFIFPCSLTGTISVVKDDKIKFYPIAGASRASIWQLGFVRITVIFYPDGKVATITGAT